MDKDLIKKIESGEIKMTPKYYFMLRDILVIVAAVLIFVVSIFFVSMVFFEIRESGATVLPGFGSAGFKVFITILPWIQILLAFVLTFILSLVLKQYSFAYRKPLLYLPITVVAVLLVISGLVGIAPLHKKIRDMSRQNSGASRYFGEFYPEGEIGDDKIISGQIISTSPEGLKLISKDDNFTVLISKQTQFPFGDDFLPNEKIIVIGERNNDNIFQAIAIRRLPQPNPMPSAGFRLFRP